MILPALFFYLFAGICVASAVMVIVSRNPVHSVLFLILAFVNASGLFVLMGAEFLAMILVVVYVGAVAVLFLFVIMMLDVDFAELREGFLEYLPIGLVIGAVFLDGGYPAAAQFVQRNWEERMRTLKRPLRDPKTVLQEWAQGKGLPTPVYREVERTGPHHDPQFRIAVDLPGLAPAEGVGGSKRAAEKVAASAMIAREGVK